MMQGADSGGNGSPVPIETDRSFRRKVITRYDSKRSLIPMETDHPFQSNPISA
jgi:hypothetical protein